MRVRAVTWEDRLRERRGRRRLGSIVSVAVTLAPALASATEYEIFIDIDTEEELYDLFQAEQISEDTFNTLVELHRKGVDLNEASRSELYTLPNLNYDDVDAILAYRVEVGSIEDPAQLVAAGVLSERKLASIATFLLVRDKDRRLAATNGRVRYQTALTFGGSRNPEQPDGVLWDDRVPPMALQARISTLRQLTIGAAGVVTRNRIGEVAWDPNRQALNAKRNGTQAHVPKYFAQWETEKWGVIAGTYRIGFGQRLTFDNTDRYTPNGFYLDDALFWSTDLALECREAAGELGESPCAGVDGDIYVTPDWRWRDGLRGVSAGVKHLEVPVGWLQAYGFVSHERKDIYQYEIYDRNQCEDPTEDDNEACSAPDTYVRQDDLLSPTSRFTFSTLPDMYDEIVGGGNFSYFINRRAHVGITGYGATVNWRAEGADLDFQEWSRTPYGGPFGAVGADASWGKGWADLFLEVAYSFDSQLTQVRDDAPDPAGGGGLGAILRHTATWKHHELEGVLRYYDRDFNNPYSRPLAAPDEFDGIRARDEVGGRLKYNGRIVDRVDMRALLDVWVQPEEQTRDTADSDEPRGGARPQMLTYLRTDADATSWFRPGVWLQYQSRDLRNIGGAPAGVSPCFDSFTALTDESGEPVLCTGQRFQVFGRLGFQPIKRMRITAQYQHAFTDDPRRGGGPGSELTDEQKAETARQDMSTWLILTTNPVDGLRFRARARYLNEEISDNSSLEESFWAYFDTAYTIKKLMLLRLRYDIRAWLDQRDNTRNRIPSPEHWVRLELEARF